MSRTKPSANYVIVTTLIMEDTAISEMKIYVKGFFKRIHELKRMGFEFEQGKEYILLSNLPSNYVIDHDKQVIKVGDYHKNYRIKLKKEKEESEKLFNFYMTAPVYKLVIHSLYVDIKEFIHNLFK